MSSQRQPPPSNKRNRKGYSSSLEVVDNRGESDGGKAAPSSNVQPLPSLTSKRRKRRPSGSGPILHARRPTRSRGPVVDIDVSIVPKQLQAFNNVPSAASSAAAPKPPSVPKTTHPAKLTKRTRREEERARQASNNSIGPAVTSPGTGDSTARPVLTTPGATSRSSWQRFTRYTSRGSPAHVADDTIDWTKVPKQLQPFNAKGMTESTTSTTMSVLQQQQTSTPHQGPATSQHTATRSNKISRSQRLSDSKPQVEDSLEVSVPPTRSKTTTIPKRSARESNSDGTGWVRSTRSRRSTIGDNDDGPVDSIKVRVPKELQPFNAVGKREKTATVLRQQPTSHHHQGPEPTNHPTTAGSIVPRSTLASRGPDQRAVNVKTMQQPVPNKTTTTTTTRPRRSTKETGTVGNGGVRSTRSRRSAIGDNGPVDLTTVPKALQPFNSAGKRETILQQQPISHHQGPSSRRQPTTANSVSPRSTRASRGPNQRIEDDPEDSFKTMQEQPTTTTRPKRSTKESGSDGIGGIRSTRSRRSTLGDNDDGPVDWATVPKELQPFNAPPLMDD